MKRSILGIVAFAALLAAFPAVSEAQRPTKRGDQSGYLVIRVNVASQDVAPGNVPGGPLGTPPAGEFPMGTTPKATTSKKPNPGDLGRSVVAVVPFKKLEYRNFYPTKGVGAVPLPRNPRTIAAVTNYGHTFLYADGTTTQLYLITEKSFEKEVKSRYDKWIRNKTLDELHDIIGAALEAGMLDDVVKYFEEMAKLLAAKKETDPPARVVAAVKAFKTISEKLDAALPASGEEERWKRILPNLEIAERAHYSLINHGENAISPDTVNRRIETLETNFRALYLTYAHAGHALPFPKTRMLAYLAEKSGDIARLREALDGEPVVADSFYSPSNNLLVLAPERMDSIGRAFERQMNAENQIGWQPSDLLAGKAPPIDEKTTPVEIARLMTLTLADKLVETDSELGAATREGTRQILTSIELLPRHVDMPYWVAAGAVSTFHRPHGPALVTGSAPGIGVMLTPGYGKPNYILARKYREWYNPTDPKERAKIPAPEVILKNILLDKYFEAARTGVEIEPLRIAKKGGEVPLTGGSGVVPIGGFGGRPMLEEDGLPGRPLPGPGPRPLPTPNPGTEEVDPLEEKRAAMEMLQLKAETTAWALTYYLQKRRLTELHQFYTEFQKMPRDMKLDRNLTLTAFCKTFKLLNADGSINEPEFRNFAMQWMDMLAGVTAPGVEIPLTSFVTDANNADPDGFPNPGR